MKHSAVFTVLKRTSSFEDVSIFKSPSVRTLFDFKCCVRIRQLDPRQTLRDLDLRPLPTTYPRKAPHVFYKNGEGDPQYANGYQEDSRYGNVLRVLRQCELALVFRVLNECKVERSLARYVSTSAGWSPISNHLLRHHTLPYLVLAAPAQGDGLVVARFKPAEEEGVEVAGEVMYPLPNPPLPHIPERVFVGESVGDRDTSMLASLFVNGDLEGMTYQGGRKTYVGQGRGEDEAATGTSWCYMQNLFSHLLPLPDGYDTSRNTNLLI